MSLSREEKRVQRQVRLQQKHQEQEQQYQILSQQLQEIDALLNVELKYENIELTIQQYSDQIQSIDILTAVFYATDYIIQQKLKTKSVNHVHRNRLISRLRRIYSRIETFYDDRNLVIPTPEDRTEYLQND